MVIAWFLATSSPGTVPILNRLLATGGMSALAAASWLSAYRRLAVVTSASTSGRAILLFQVILVTVGGLALLAGLFTRGAGRRQARDPVTQVHLLLALTYALPVLLLLVAMAATYFLSSGVLRIGGWQSTYVVWATALAPVTYGTPLGVWFVLSARHAERVAPSLRDRRAFFVPPIVACVSMALLYSPVWLHLTLTGATLRGEISGRFLLLPLVALLQVAGALFLWHAGCWAVLAKAHRGE